MDLPLGYLFRGLDDDQLKRIAAVAREVSMENGEQICREEEEAKDLYILKDTLREIRDGLSSIANGGIKATTRSAKIKEFKQAARQYRNMADETLSRIRS